MQSISQWTYRWQFMLHVFCYWKPRMVYAAVVILSHGHWNHKVIHCKQVCIVTLVRAHCAEHNCALVYISVGNFVPELVSTRYVCVT